MATAPRIGSSPTRLTVANGALQSSYRRDSLVIVALPAAGFAGAVAWATARGITWLDVALMVGMYAITVLGIDVGFHRYFAHRSFQASRGARVALAIAGSMAAQGRLIRWVSNHRRHHAYSDSPDDPHSPHADHRAPEGRGLLGGFWYSHVAWIFEHEPTNAIHFSKDIIRDPLLAFINRWYLAWILLGMSIPAAIGGAVRGSWTGALEGLLFGWAAPVFLSQNAAFFVNSVGHLWGARPFVTNDRSANVWWLAIPSVGAAYQNNHHAFPSSATTRIDPWQLDLGGLFIRALAAMGMAWDLNVPAEEAVRRARKARRPQEART